MTLVDLLVAMNMMFLCHVFEVSCISLWLHINYLTVSVHYCDEVRVCRLLLLTMICAVLYGFAVTVSSL